jgi:nitrogen fixation/metabolism regulation signal transduction histidine kinase
MESQFQLIDDQDPEISRLFELYRMALTQLSKNSRQHIDIPSDTVIRYNPGMESFFSLSGQINSRLMAHREEYNRQVALSHSQLAISVRFIERNIFLSYALFMVFVLVLFLSYTERLFSPINRLNHQLEAEGGLAYPLVFPRDSGSEIEKMASSLNRIKAVFFNRDDEKKKKIRHQQIKVEHMGNLISKMIICFDDQYRITYINEKGMSLLSGNGTTYIGQNLLIINSTLFESVITCLTEEIFKKPRQVSFSQGGKYLTLTMMIIPCIFSSYTEYILILDEESLLAEAPGVGADAALEA